MAKGKHAAALFEVIQSDKRFQGKPGVPGGLRTPVWLSKAKAKADAAAAEPALGLPARSPAPATLIIPPMMADRTLPPVTLDTQRQVISFRLSYLQVILIAGGLLATIVLAVIVGRQLAGRQPELGPSSETIQRGPVAAQALDVPPDRQIPSASAHGARSTPMAQLNPGASKNPPANVARASSALVQSNANRAVGLNYVIVQGYPEDQKAMATEARDVLAKNGIVCTIEKGLPKFKSDWYYVVGIDGFSRVRSSEYKAYFEKIEKISSQYAGQHSFKAFDPQGYRWTGPSNDARDAR